MSFLSDRRFVDGASGWYLEELHFFGTSLEEVDHEMRQWILHTMPMGACSIEITTAYATDGPQHHITLTYACRQRAEDRIEPKGIFGEEAASG